MIVSLIGYMGCGKSTLGKKLANKLNYTFIDLDHEIETIELRSVNEIFAEEGEDYFREVEKNVLIEMLSKENIVLSLGGGTPCFYSNMELINNSSISVYINLPVTTLAQRLEQGKSSRPIIADKSNEELLEFIENHLSAREKYYNKSKITFNPLKEGMEDLISRLS